MTPRRKRVPWASEGRKRGPGRILSPEASAILRDQLLADLAGFGSQDDLDAWALHAWPKANTLMPADGDVVREAFQARLAQLQAIPGLDLSRAEPDPLPANANAHSRIDKSVLALPEAKRLRDKQHLRFVAKQPCLVCGREPCDPHHLRFAQSRGLGLKVSDEFAVPLCRAHHRELHRAGKEVDWWARNRHRADRHRAQALARNPSADGLGKSSQTGTCGARNETPDQRNEATAVPQQLRAMEMAKRTQLPGPPT